MKNLLVREQALTLANSVATEYGRLPQVEAVALAGSRTGFTFEPSSDIDLYVYWQTELPLEDRHTIVQASAARADVDNQFWEPGDEWIDKATGIQVDVMFRHTRWIEEQLDRVLEHHEASVGYSTCFWHNVLTSNPLIDMSGWFAELRTKATMPYPDQLRKNIVAKNYPILRDTLSSYLCQIKHAVRRDDRVSINHRVAALLASYFDILFAVNRMPHPGEKRLLQIAEANCDQLPEEMMERVSNLLTAAGGAEAVVEHANLLIGGLADLLQQQDLLEPKLAGLQSSRSSQARSARQ